MRASLDALDATVAAADDTGWAATEEGKQRILAAADTREGVAAFFERRPPVVPGPPTELCR